MKIKSKSEHVIAAKLRLHLKQNCIWVVEVFMMFLSFHIPVHDCE